jgi:hypothetical protein
MMYIKWLYLFMITLSQAVETDNRNKPKKELDFNNGSTVEGINESDYSSLFSYNDQKKLDEKNHLYQKKTDFHNENRSMLPNVRYTK